MSSIVMSLICGIVSQHWKRRSVMGELRVREATAADLPRIVELIAQLYSDPTQEDYGAARARYEAAFAEIIADRRQTLFVADLSGAVVGSLVLIIVPNLTRRGRPYGIIENVVVDANRRGAHIGEAMMDHAIATAREAGCHKVALMSRVERKDAHRFYERLGFAPAHVGYRLDL
jgi:ribosomal protein S18 acetylase RimI-like enzyme